MLVPLRSDSDSQGNKQAPVRHTQMAPVCFPREQSTSLNGFQMQLK